MLINPNDSVYHNVQLWCIYGAKSFPTMFCCKIIMNADYGPIIQGYSVYRRQPGFRTLGQNVNNWIQRLRTEYGYDLFEFYDNHDEAILRIASLTRPSDKSVT